MLHTSLKETLKTVMPLRHATIVEEALNNIDIYDPGELRGYRIPAHFATDLRGIPLRTVVKLEALMVKHGATLVK